MKLSTSGLGGQQAGQEGLYLVNLHFAYSYHYYYVCHFQVFVYFLRALNVLKFILENLRLKVKELFCLLSFVYCDYDDGGDRGEEMFEFRVVACLCRTTSVPTNCGEQSGLLPSGS